MSGRHFYANHAGAGELARPHPWKALLMMQVRDRQIQRKYRKYTQVQGGTD
jgi:hypothetical protein